MSTIQSGCLVSHLDSGLSSQADCQRISHETAFVASVLDLTTTAEAITTGDVITPHTISIKHLGGDAALIGFSNSVFPMRVKDQDGRGESCMIRLDLETKRQIGEVTTKPDEPAKRLAGTYFDMSDRSGAVRVWFATTTEVATVQVVSLSGIGGQYFSLRDSNNAEVRVWVNVNNASTPPAFPSGGYLLEADYYGDAYASGTITYGNPTAAVKATGTLTLNSNPANGETVTIGTRTYTFKTALSVGPTVADEVLIGAAATDSIDNLVLAITEGADIGVKYSTGTVAHDVVIAAAGALDTMVVTALAHGTAGNIASTETLADVLSIWGGSVLTGGVNGDTVTVDGTTFTCVNSGATGDQFTNAETLATKIDGLPNVGAVNNSGIIAVTATALGLSGNDIEMSKSSIAGFILSGAFLTGGFVAQTIDDLAATIATLVDSHEGLSATVDGNAVTITNDSVGPRANIVTSSSGTLAVATVRDGTVAPAAPTAPSRLIQVNILPDSQADAVATALASTLDADSEFIAVAVKDKVTITDQHVGVRSISLTNGGGASTTGFALNTTVAPAQSGAASTEVWVKSTGTSQVLVAVAPN